ncbi:hypothetical protein LTS18_008000 [Coniosporium uncinatum]|uniref:Uncharacterized protein n=1 Tax=Coniosporium uncinatum TaxID=93489 RepID=A0ACC3DAS7_9PEZI|nr:hypothetical protein LTS18_008000 [Coniosporium uncinatum]
MSRNYVSYEGQDHDSVSTASVTQASSDAGTEGEDDCEKDTQSLHDLLMHFDEVEQPVVQQEGLENGRREEAGADQDEFHDTQSDEESEEE